MKKLSLYLHLILLNHLRNSIRTKLPVTLLIILLCCSLQVLFHIPIKLRKVVDLDKKDSKQDFSNYRRISLLPNLKNILKS